MFFKLLRSLLIGLFFIPLFSYGQGEFLSVCDRTVQVKEAIMKQVAQIDSSIECSDDDLMVNILPEIKTLGVLSLEHRGYLKSLFFKKSLKAGDFSGLSSLQSLGLSNNQINSLHKDTFSGLSSLEHLSLSNNQISSLHEDTFSGLSSLTHLYLSDNQISSLHKDTFLGLSSLIYLDLKKNNISSLHKDVFSDLSSLHYLALFNNKIKSFPEGIFVPLSSLKEIGIGMNPIGVEQELLLRVYLEDRGVILKY